MWQVPDAAVGAIVAALIGGTISLLGLIISKEQKTSEFRQAWIDAVRKSISEYITRINAIQDVVKSDFDDHKSKVEILHAHYVPLNAATFDILLRVNPKEDRSKRLTAVMDQFNQLFLDDTTITASEIRPLEVEFLGASQDLLKAEWRRVKSGELTFQVAKWAALAVVIVTGGLGIWAFVKSQEPQAPSAASSPQLASGSGVHHEANRARNSAKVASTAEAQTSSPGGGDQAPQDQKPALTNKSNAR